MLPARIVAALGLSLALGSADAQEGQHTVSPAFPAYKAQLAQDIRGRIHRIPYRSQTGGMALVRFRIDRAGKVVASAILTSSGNPYIDGLALKVISVGSKLLPIPADIPSPGIIITVPLRFPPRYH